MNYDDLQSLKSNLLVTLKVGRKSQIKVNLKIEQTKRADSVFRLHTVPALY